MRIHVITICCFLAIMSGLGCQSARYIQKTEDRGVVAIPRNSNRYPNYRDQANELMIEHFPDGYLIEHEEEVVVGQTTHYREDEREEIVHASNEKSAAARSANGSETTVPKTEYRIHYRRKASAN